MGDDELGSAGSFETGNDDASISCGGANGDIIGANGLGIRVEAAASVASLNASLRDSSMKSMESGSHESGGLDSKSECSRDETGG